MSAFGSKPRQTQLARSSRGKVARRAALGAVLLGALAFTVPAVGSVLDPTLRSTSTTQMASTPETFYVNSVSDAEERTQSFNENWKFYLGEVTGAQQAAYDDSTWENVNVPHDYSIDQDYSQTGEGESAYKPGGVGWYRKSFEVSKDLEGKRVRIDFDGVYMDATVYINGHELGTHPYGYSPFAFDLTPYINFGGQNVIAVRVNHQIPSSRWYSGSGIGRDVDLVITDPVHVEKNGVVVTTPDLEDGNYTTHLVTTIANAGEKDVTVSVQQSVLPKDGGDAIGTVTTENQAVTAGASVEVAADLTPTTTPSLWDTENPSLYVARTEVIVDGTVVDTYDVTFGYRWFEYRSSAETTQGSNGFYLNGEFVKIKGVCMHHDQGSLGSVDTRAAIERQVRILKEMGCNSIRTSHNTPSRNLVEVCQEQGILLDEEIFDGWTEPKNGNTNDYARFFDEPMGESELVGNDANKTWAQWDLEQTIARDINSPSVIMWSVGNEMITGTPNSSIPNFQTVQTNLINWVKAADPTRPATLGDNQLKSGNWAYNPGVTDSMGGIIGINYADGNRYQSVHTNNPNMVLYGSETVSATNSRGVYNTMANNATNVPDQQLTSYDVSCVSWGHLASQAWYDTVRFDYVMGEYVWTGFDYLGEPTPWNGTSAGQTDGISTWPRPKNSYFGIIDTAGLPKDTYYFYQSQWNDKVNTLHILPAWNENMVYKNGDGNVPVVVYTDAAEVELFFTPTGSDQATSLGKKKFTQVKSSSGEMTYQIYQGQGADGTTHKNLYLTWYVPYEDGTITAKAYDANGDVLDTSTWDGRQSVTTTGKAAKLVASVDRQAISADGTDLAYVTVSVVDENGNIVPNATNNVKFEVTGAGELAAVDNGSSPDWQSYRDDNRDAWAGQLVGIVRADKTGGEITVKVGSDGLKDASVTINAAATGEEPAEESVESLFFSRYYYVKAGAQLSLPQTVTVNYTNGTSKDNVAVTWDEVSDELLSKPGTFEVEGEVEGATVSAVVTVVDDVPAVLNYTATVQAGGKIQLPDTRPGAMASGAIVNANFPVTWDEYDPDQVYDSERTVTFTGKASVFGRDVDVTATVRVQEQTYELGGNLASPTGSFLRIEQDVPQNQQSDNLNALVDGSTACNNNGADGDVWTNYNYAQETQSGTSSVTIVLNTSLGIGQAKIYFFDDGWSCSYPKANTTKIEVSGSGDEGSWTEVEYRETISTDEISGEGTKNAKLYTYDFDPVNAVFVRITMTSGGEKADQFKGTACVGASEIELISATGSYTTNTTAELESLKVNGQEVSAADLAAGEFNTPATVIAENGIEAVGADNAAVTVLPAQDGKALIIIESEDHLTRNTFAINLGVEPQIDPSDDSKDIPVNQITATSDQEQSGDDSATEGPVRLAFDGKANTHYHSAYSNNAPVYDLEETNIVMSFESPTEVSALRYLPRTGTGDGANNGVIVDYVIEYADSEDGPWKIAAKGSWEDIATNKDWHIAEFDKPINAKYFKLSSTHTLGSTDGTNEDLYMSAAEIRLVGAEGTVDISSAELDAPTEAKAQSFPFVFDVDDVTVTLGDTELRYGIDYVLEYENNDQPGTATMTIRGIYGGAVNYTGTVTHEFEITGEAVLEGISVTTAPTKATYEVGDKLDPSGLVLTLAWSYGEPTTVAYNADNAADFTFEPTTFDKVGNVDVTVTYKGKKATFTVTVNADVADLNAAIDEAQKLDSADYTAETWSALQTALTKALAARDSGDQARIDAATQALNAAIEALAPAQNQGGNQGGTTGGNQGGNTGGNQGGNTGGNTGGNQGGTTGGNQPQGNGATRPSGGSGAGTASGDALAKTGDPTTVGVALATAVSGAIALAASRKRR